MAAARWTQPSGEPSWLLCARSGTKKIRSPEFRRELKALVERFAVPVATCFVTQEPLWKTLPPGIDFGYQLPKEGIGLVEVDLCFLPDKYRQAFRQCDLSLRKSNDLSLLTRTCSLNMSSGQKGSAFAALTQDGYVLIAEATLQTDPMLRSEKLVVQFCVFSPITRTYRELPVLLPAHEDLDLQMVAAPGGGFQVFVLGRFPHSMWKFVTFNVYRWDVNTWTRISNVYWDRYRIDWPKLVLCTLHTIYYVEGRKLIAYDLDANTQSVLPWPEEGDVPVLSRLCEHRGTLYLVHTATLAVEIFKLDIGSPSDWEFVSRMKIDEIEHPRLEYYVPLACIGSRLEIEGVSVVGNMICMGIRLVNNPDQSRYEAAGHKLQYWHAFHLVERRWDSVEVTSWIGSQPAFLFECQPQWL